MRSIFTLLLSLFLIQIASAQWKKKVVVPPPVIQCGVSIPYGSTWGEGNDFNATNFGDFVSDASNTYDGEDVIYQFKVDVESDVRITLESMCAKGTFLMMDKGEGVLKPLASSEFDPAELGQTKAFLGAVRVYPGTYFLVIDSPDKENCEMFSLLLECTPYEAPTICELGGDAIACGHQITGTLPELPEVIIPLGTPPAIVPPLVGCNRDETQSIRTYQAYFDNPGTITATVSPGFEALIYSRDCACSPNLSATCLSMPDCSANQFGINQINNATGGFYNIVVVGPPNATFELQVDTDDCNCDFARTPIIVNGPAVTGFPNDSTNNFDNVVAVAPNVYENCYSGNRPYTGGDFALEFELETTSRVTITLSSFIDAGLFLFNHHCASDCLAMDETFGLEGTASIDDFLLPPGIYTIIVDLAKRHPSDWGQTVRVTGRPVNDSEKPEVKESTINSTIEIFENLPFNHTGEESDLESDDFALLNFFYSGTDDCIEDVPAGEKQVVDATVPLKIPADDSGGRAKNGFETGEPIRLTLTLDGDFIGFVDGSFAQNQQNVTERGFKPNETIRLFEISTPTTFDGAERTITMTPRDRGIAAGGGIARYEIFTNSSRAEVEWCINATANGESIPGLTAQIGRRISGTSELRINIPEYDADEDRTVELVLSGIATGQDLSFDIMQYGQNSCKNDTEAPKPVTVPTKDDVVQFFWPEDGFINGVKTRGDRLIDSIKANFHSEIKLSDNCTDEDLLKLEVATSPFSNPTDLAAFKAGTPFFITLRTRDLAGKEFTFSFNIAIIIDSEQEEETNDDTGNRIANLNLTNGNLHQNQTVLEIFPNPNKGQFQMKIQGLTQGQKELFIYNAFGQQVKHIARTSDASTSYISVDMQGFNRGIYFVQLKSNNQIISKKMILSN